MSSPIELTPATSVSLATLTHSLLVIVICPAVLYALMLFSQLDLDIRPGSGLGIFKLGQCLHASSLTPQILNILSF
jgi:hypothetical protein